MHDYQELAVNIGRGQTIMSRRYSPSTDVKGVVLMVPGMGITQAFYASFASWLADQGFSVVTFDYRGIGDSLVGRLRDCDVDILDWAQRDCAAMIDSVVGQHPGLPIYWVGHSLGGQISAFVPNLHRITKIVTIASGSGYWRDCTRSNRKSMWWLWFVAAPVMLRLFASFPGKKLRKVGDLPFGVMSQWRRWCLNREYSAGAEAAHQRYAAVAQPTVSLSFTDDEFMSARSTEVLNGFFTGSDLRSKRIAPQDVGATRIGHVGFFRAQFEQSLWHAHLLPELS